MFRKLLAKFFKRQQDEERTSSIFHNQHTSQFVVMCKLGEDVEFVYITTSIQAAEQTADEWVHYGTKKE